MHKAAMEMGKWAMEKAKACGFDKLSPQDWDDINHAKTILYERGLMESSLCFSP